MADVSPVPRHRVSLPFTVLVVYGHSSSPIDANNRMGATVLRSDNRSQKDLEIRSVFTLPPVKMTYIAGTVMSKHFLSYPQYPDECRDDLPSPRTTWSKICWIGFVALGLSIPVGLLAWGAAEGILLLAIIIPGMLILFHLLGIYFLIIIAFIYERDEHDHS